MRTQGIKLFDLRLHIKLLRKEDILHLLDSGRDKSNSEWRIYVITNCLHEFKDAFLVIDRMGLSVKHGVDVIYRKLYEHCLVSNPRLSVRPTKLAPCPHCRGTQITCSAIMSAKSHLWGRRRVYCPGCKLFVFKGYRVQPVTTACSTNEAARKAWNNFCRRVNSLPLPEKRRTLLNILNGRTSIDYKLFETRRE